MSGKTITTTTGLTADSTVRPCERLRQKTAAGVRVSSIFVSATGSESRYILTALLLNPTGCFFGAAADEVLAVLSGHGLERSVKQGNLAR